MNESDEENSIGKSHPELASTKILDLQVQAEHMLRNAILMTEMGMDLKERSASGEKYACYLKSLSIRAGKTINALHASSREFLVLAQKLVSYAMETIDNLPITDETCNIKLEYEKLQAVIERELSEIEDREVMDTYYENAIDIANMSEKIKHLEIKQKMHDNSPIPSSNSAKSVKSDVDEKYPENLSRDSPLDLNNVINLPTVPEDIFTSCSNKPIRTCSLSSLKSMRKVKLFLQRASSASDDEDEGSEIEDHDCIKFAGDGDEVKSAATNPPFALSKKVCLGNIKEETQD